MSKPVVLYATVWAEDTHELRQREITEYLIRQSTKQDTFDLKVLIITAHPTAAKDAAEVMGLGVDVMVHYLETPYSQSNGWHQRGEEISHCKETLHRIICDRSDYDFLWFMDSDVWTPISTVNTMLKMLQPGSVDKFLRLPGLLRTGSRKGALVRDNLMAFFHTQALAEKSQYWEAVFPRKEDGERKGAPDCLINKALGAHASREDVPCMTRHFCSRNICMEHDHGVNRANVSISDADAVHDGEEDEGTGLLNFSEAPTITSMHMCAGDPNNVPERLALFEKLYKHKAIIAESLNPSRILDIGVRAGYSAWTFRQVCPDAYILGIDNCGTDHGGAGGEEGAYLKWAEVLLRGTDFDIMKMDTKLVDVIPNGPFDLIHVDGDRSAGGVLRDLSLALDVLTPDGVILVNDYYYLKDVGASVRQWVKTLKDVEAVVIRTVRGDALIRRTLEGDRVSDAIWKRGVAI